MTYASQLNLTILFLRLITLWLDKCSSKYISHSTMCQKSSTEICTCHIWSRFQRKILTSFIFLWRHKMLFLSCKCHSIPFQSLCLVLSVNNCLKYCCDFASFVSFFVWSCQTVKTGAMSLCFASCVVFRYHIKDTSHISLCST